jgi:anti-anti-sigma factor
MAVPHGNVRVVEQGPTVTFRVEGRATMALSLPLRRYAERCLEGGATALRVDLRHCTYMDSTFLGTLLTLQGAVGRRGGGRRLSLVSPSSACGQVLQQMGLGTVFGTEAADEPQGLAWAELPAVADDPVSFKRNVAQAHEELANLPGPAAEQFRAVVRCMAQADKQAPPPAR